MDTQGAVEPVSIATPVAVESAARRRDFALLAVSLGLLWFVCCRYLSAEWSFNEQYNYGWFVPVFVAYLLWLRWEDRPTPEVRSQRSEFGKIIAIFLIAAASIILLPLRVFEIGSADWRPLGWVHTTAAAAITLSIIYLAGGARWVRHFSFPVLFFFVAVPWPSPIETPIVQMLMRGIAASAAELLALFGIPAEVQGNLIRLPSGMVGVNEACSGVRSLQTSLTIGLLFGELKRLRVGSRIALVGSAIAIALVANLLRASLLVWIASTRSIAAVGRWHDIAGYAIVILVFLGTMWLASLWKTDRPPNAHASLTGRTIRLLPIWVFGALLIWFVAVEIGGELWYRVHERGSVAQPGWSVRWPQNEPGYRELKIDNEVRNLMRFDSGREVAWTSKAADSISSPQPSANYLFFFRWNPGSGTILRARAHRPDICLPAAGWTQKGSDHIESFEVAPGQSLPFHRFEFVKQGNSSVRATAFFTLHEDVAHETERGADAAAGLYSNWDWPDRWRVVRNGIRNRGQQVLEFIVVAPAQTDVANADAQFAALIPQLIEAKH